jgi:hypothetical protein
MSEYYWTPQIRGWEEGYCGDCELLTEALRDLEMQCREAENEQIRALSNFCYEDASHMEENYSLKIKKLEHRRNCALEVLIKHQQLEHREEK